jgi:formate/nitrite transporter FocA (FNT family)
MSEVFRQIDNVTAARRVRLHLATGLVPDVIWIALFAGALLTIGFTLFFGSENLLAQVCMTGVLSLLVTLGLVVIISLDHPFTGPVYIHADALSGVLEEFGKPRG